MATESNKDWAAAKKRLEKLAAERFCDLLDPRAKFLHFNEPPAPDCTIKFRDSRTAIELASYREQGPHNEAADRDQQFKLFVLDRWLYDNNVNEFDLWLTYRMKNGHFQIPDIRTQVSETEALILDLKKLTAKVTPRANQDHITFRLVPRAQVRRFRLRQPNIVFVAVDDYSSLACKISQVRIWPHPGIKMGLPQTSIQTRQRHVDFDEILRLVRQKHEKLPVYRAASGSQPVFLLMYDSGAPTGRLLDFEMPKVVKFISDQLSQYDDQFDAVWWGHNLLVNSSSLMLVQ